MFLRLLRRLLIVALFTAKSLDGLEPELLLQFIWKFYADSTHFNYQFILYFCARFARVRGFSNKQIASGQVLLLFLLSFSIHLQFCLFT